MKMYETTLIVDSTLEQEKIEQLIEKYSEIIKSAGEIVELQKWGKKRLAYPIDKKPTGYYVHFQYKAEPMIPAKLERDFVLNAKLLRFMTIALDKRALKQMEKNREKKSIAAETEEK